MIIANMRYDITLISIFPTTVSIKFDNDHTFEFRMKKKRKKNKFRNQINFKYK